MKRFKCRQLYITEKIINKIGVIEIAQQIRASNIEKEGLIVKTFYEEGNVKLDLLLNQLIQTNNFEQVTSILICEASEFYNIDGNFQIIILLCQAQYLSISQSRGKVFQVRTFHEGLKLLVLNENQIEKRWKMQKMLRQSRQKMRMKEKHSQLIGLSLKLMERRLKQHIILLAKFMNFYGVRKIRIEKKYFLEWVIIYHQKSLDHFNEELLKGYQLINRSNIKLVKKCLLAWKEMAKQLRKNIKKRS